MASRVTESLKDKQMRKIVQFQTFLQKKTKREISVAEAFVNWLALGLAEDYRNNFSPQES